MPQGRVAKRGMSNGDGQSHERAHLGFDPFDLLGYIGRYALLLSGEVLFEIGTGLAEGSP